jgi:nucleoside-diphosphate kinase
VDVARLLEEMMVATPVERSLVLVKPDGVKRSLTGEIIRRIEAKGIKLVALDLRSLPRELVEEHYAEHEGKPFFEPLVSFMTSGPVVAIRGDLATDIGTTVVQNLVHGSDAPVSAEREIKLFFPELG